MVIPFQVEELDIRGRAVQLGPLLDTILSRHDYPEPVARLLAEAICLTVLLGTALKFEGRFLLQTQTDGPVSLIVTDFRTPDAMRAYARFDPEAVAALDNPDTVALLGNGTLAMTLDQGQFSQRYQGIVALDGIGLEEVVRRYFLQSEQIPTDVRLAVGEVFTRQQDAEPKHSWIAGGILMQFLPDSTERMRQKDLDGGDGSSANDGFVEDDAWLEAKALLNTVEDVELTDMAVEPERLLFRLFHEQGVRVFPGVPVQDRCSCSSEKVVSMIEGFSEEERAESAEDGQIKVTCEFCSQSYAFGLDQFQ